MPPLFSNKSYFKQFLFLLLFIVGGLTIFSSLSLLMVKIFEFETNSRGYLYAVQSISSFGIFFVPAVVFSFCATKRWFSYSYANQAVSSLLTGYVMVLSLLILPVIACLGYFNEQISFPESLHKIEWWMREMEEANKIIIQRITAHSTIPILLTNIVFLALFPAIFEELLFRGTLQPFFSKWFSNKPIAILVTAFIFSAIHFQFYGFIPRFLLGIYLGYLLLWSKSLWLPIVAHFLHNAFSLILYYAAQEREIDLEAIEPSKISGFYPIVAVCAVCVTIGIYLLRKKTKMDCIRSSDISCVIKHLE
jgi:membrane protease YdiL (CAAX protease family)